MNNRFDTFNPDIDITYGSEENNLTYGSDEAIDEKPQRTRQPRKPSQRKPAKASKKPSAKGKAIKESVKSATDFVTEIKNFATDGRTRAAVGITALLFGTYLLIAFISFLTAGFHDQSQVVNSTIGDAGQVKNLAGEGGARISELLINDSFGIAAGVIILWLIGVALKQFGLLKFKIVNFTIKCIVALITVSLIVGLLTIGLDAHFLWGGAHGYYINQTIIQFLGWAGAALLSVLLVALFFIICCYDIYKFAMRIHNKRKEARLAREEEKRRQEEISQKVAELQALEDERESLSEVQRMNDFDSHGMTFEVDTDEPVDSPAELENTLEENPEQEEDGPQLRESEETTPEDESQKSESIDIQGEGQQVMTVTVNEISKATESERKKAVTPLEAQGEFDPRAELSHYKFPSTDLLRNIETRISVDENEQLENQERIRATLADFGIVITDIKATVGPTVTLYEIRLDSGIRINRVRNLGDDIALSLAARGVRIIAPIPGRGTVGIEVANKDPQTVSMRTVVESRKYVESRYELPIAIGSTINNQVYIADLAKMPHLLVAGATGQGKSVGLNAMIASLLYRKHPAELKFVLVDPKMVEFSLYRAIENHYLAKLEDEPDAVLTKCERVVATLSSLCVEMDNRYELLRAAGVRNIKEYNARFKRRELNPENGHKFMPYIVVIVDEFADLIMQVGREIETPIARLAQKARAIGIHVILATQRPSANVITGVIKANFPARVAFKVSSGIDSKTILDTTGAQALIGRGDMLISNNSEMERVQCAFIDTPEVTAICDHIASQQGYSHPYFLPEPVLNADGETAHSEGAGTFGDRDPLFEEIARLIVTSNTASTSSVQRRFRIGYNRAGYIMDQLEAAGVVGPAQGGKPRQVLVDMATLETILGL